MSIQSVNAKGKGLKVGKPAEAPAPAAAGKKIELEKATAAAMADIPVQSIDESILGSKSDTVAFVAALGDPSDPDTTTTEVGGQKDVRVVPRIVGYRFKALVDMEVPDCGTEDDFKKNKMSFVAEKKNNRRPVKAGETFDLTRFETGMLLSPVEFNGKATGGDKPVQAVYQMSKKTAADGSIAKVSAATALPTVSLRALTGSIMDYQMINVLNFTTEDIKNSEGKVVSKRKHRTIIPGFEKWAPLCNVAQRRATTVAKSPAAKRLSGADVFLKIVNAK